MLLRHATPSRNLASIQRLGLLTSKSRGKLKVVWLHAPSRTNWATLHVSNRHGVRLEDVVVLTINVPRSWLRRGKAKLWYSLRDIPPGRLGKVLTFAELGSVLLVLPA